MLLHILAAYTLGYPHAALTALQRSLLLPDLEQMRPHEWKGCMDNVLFPLLNRLLDPANAIPPNAVEETRMRAWYVATVVAVAVALAVVVLVVASCIPLPDCSPPPSHLSPSVGSTLLCKVFLQHLSALLSLEEFTGLWLRVLDYMDKYMHAGSSELLMEAVR